MPCSRMEEVDRNAGLSHFKGFPPKPGRSQLEGEGEEGTCRSPALREGQETRKGSPDSSRWFPSTTGSPSLCSGAQDQIPALLPLPAWP